jgi:hypothetical protein
VFVFYVSFLDPERAGAGVLAVRDRISRRGAGEMVRDV